MTTLIQPSDADVIAAAYAATVQPLAAARSLGPLPPMHSADFVESDVAVRRAVLLVAGLHEALIAGPERRGALRQAALDVHGAAHRDHWRRLASRFVPHEEMQRRRSRHLAAA